MRCTAAAGDGCQLQQTTRLSEIGVFEAAKTMRSSTMAAKAIRHYIISHTETVSDLLEVLLLQKEVGLMRGTLDAPARHLPI
jgi:phosphoenolpyruvate carboxylase